MVWSDFNNIKNHSQICTNPIFNKTLNSNFFFFLFCIWRIYEISWKVEGYICMKTHILTSYYIVSIIIIVQKMRRFWWVGLCIYLFIG